jgi:UDP-N-acetylglucosamine diphosphorylase/glucosamine-1-phosphate N-acetyltransferase
MSKALVLFEDEFAANFEPIALTRSVARLRCGLWTHQQRWHRAHIERSIHLLCRAYLTDSEVEQGGWESVNQAVPADDVLFVAAALGAPDEGRIAQIRALGPDEALVTPDRRLVAASLGSEKASRLLARLRETLGEDPFPTATPDWRSRLTRESIRVIETAPLPATLVDLVSANARAIESDFGPEPVARDTVLDAPGVHVVNPARIRVGEGVHLEPGVVIDASAGPVLIGAGTRVMANSVLRGPVAIGRDCVIRSLSRLADGVSLGPVCRIGGEVDAVIVQGYSNKQHDGFLGHSYLGEWVNLGAATDTSDLKNDYGSVRIVVAGATIDTQSRSVGSLIGDHSKTAIHTSLNTGTVIGVSSNVFGSGFPPKEIPSFTWGGGGPDWQEYQPKRALEVARRVMERRRVVLTDTTAELLGRVYQATRHRRRACLPARDAVSASER